MSQMTSSDMQYQIIEVDGRLIIIDSYSHARYVMECFTREYILKFEQRQKELRDRDIDFCTVYRYRIILTPENPLRTTPIDIALGGSVSGFISKFHYGQFAPYCTTSAAGRLLTTEAKEKPKEETKAEGCLTAAALIVVIIIAIGVISLASIFGGGLAAIIGIFAVLVFGKEVLK